MGRLKGQGKKKEEKGKRKGRERERERKREKKGKGKVITLISAVLVRFETVSKYRNNRTNRKR